MRDPGNLTSKSWMKWKTSRSNTLMTNHVKQTEAVPLSATLSSVWPPRSPKFLAPEVKRIPVAGTSIPPSTKLRPWTPKKKASQPYSTCANQFQTRLVYASRNKACTMTNLTYQSPKSHILRITLKKWNSHRSSCFGTLKYWQLWMSTVHGARCPKLNCLLEEAGHKEKRPTARRSLEWKKNCNFYANGT